MPTRTVVSLPLRTHSCSLVYFRSSGYSGTLAPDLTLSSRGGLWGCWLSVLILLRAVQGVDHDLVEELDLHSAGDPRPGDLADDTATEAGRLLQRVRFADDL